MRAVTSGKSSANSFCELGLHPVARFQVLRHDDGLGHEVVVELHVERQVEADGPAADIGGEAGDVGIADSAFSRRLVSASVAAMEAFFTSDIVTRSSGRLDAGKNCCCT